MPCGEKSQEKETMKSGRIAVLRCHVAKFGLVVFLPTI